MVAANGAQSVSRLPTFADLISAHCQAARVEMAGTPGITDPILAFLGDGAASPEALRAKTAARHGVGLEVADSKSELAIPPDSDSMAPASRGAELQVAMPGAQRMLRSLSVGANAIVAEQVRHAPSAHGPGGARYPYLCTRSGAARFPPKSIIVRRASTDSGQGRNFAIYVRQGPPPISFRLLEAATSRRGDTVRAIDTGISNKHSK